MHVSPPWVSIVTCYVVFLSYSFPISHERSPNVAFLESVSNAPPVRCDPLHVVTAFFWRRAKFRQVWWTPHDVRCSFTLDFPATTTMLLGTTMTLCLSLLLRAACLHLSLCPLDTHSKMVLFCDRFHNSFIFSSPVYLNWWHENVVRRVPHSSWRLQIWGFVHRLLKRVLP